MIRTTCPSKSSVSKIIPQRFPEGALLPSFRSLEKKDPASPGRGSAR
jgi:hypothetical protein